MRKIIYTVAAIGLAGAAIYSGAAFAWTGEKYAPQAKVTMDQATAIALKERPGTVTDRELERENGGSGLRYSFDVKGSDGVVYEIGVDAKTGKVLEDSKEGKNPD